MRNDQQQQQQQNQNQLTAATLDMVCQAIARECNALTLRQVHCKLQAKIQRNARTTTTTMAAVAIALDLLCESIHIAIAAARLDWPKAAESSRVSCCHSNARFSIHSQHNKHFWLCLFVAIAIANASCVCVVWLPCASMQVSV